MAKVLIALALVAAIAASAVNAAQTVRSTCFPASKWGPQPGSAGGVKGPEADDGLRPCVRVTRVYEDGSFKFAVSDADGTVRYSGGVGALDR